jgi:hypothetical protein
MMIKNKLFLAIVVFFFTATAQAYTSLNYKLHGDLLSYSIFSSTGVLQAYALDPAKPFTIGTADLLYYPETDGHVTIGMTLNPSYHVVHNLPYWAEQVTYAGLTQKTNSLAAFFAPGTNNLIGNGSSRTEWGIGSWCASSQAVTCADLYSEHRPLPFSNNGSTSMLDLLFSDATLQNFNGTVIVNSKLNSGGWIERTYSLSGVAVPLPMSGMLFGSAVLALAGVRRRTA